MSDDRPGRRPPDPPRLKAAIDGVPSNQSIFQFLHRLFDSGFPQRISLWRAKGRKADRFDIQLLDRPFKANAALPTREALIEMSNELVQVAQDDCDVRNEPTKYAIFAHDLARGDKPYSQQIFALKPSGVFGFSDGRDNPENEEDNVLSTKLLLQLLSGEQRDKRWIFEQFGERMERMDDRVEKLMSILTEMTGKLMGSQIEYIVKTQEALDRKAERDEKIATSQFKREALEKGVLILGQLVPVIGSAISEHTKQLKAKREGGEEAKQIAAPASNIQTVTETPAVSDIQTVTETPAASEVEPNEIMKFLQSIDDEQSAAAFGEFDESRNQVTPGLFTVEQSKMFVALAKQDVPDDALVDQLRASITEEQGAKALEIFGLMKLAPLQMWMNSRKK